MSILNVNKINPVGGGSTITIAGIASVTNNLTATNISAGSSVTANAFYGDGSNLTGAGPTLTNGADNRVVTATGANALNGEANLTFNGSTLQVNGDGQFTGNDGTANQLKWDKSDDSLYFRDGVKAQFGTGGDLELYHNGTDSYIANATNNFRIGNTGSTNLKFFTNNSTRWNIDGSGHFVPDTNNAVDIGSSSVRVRNIYTNDLNLSNEGSSNDVDGTWGDFTIQEGENDLFLINKRNGKKYKFNLTEVS